MLHIKFILKIKNGIQEYHSDQADYNTGNLDSVFVGVGFALLIVWSILLESNF